METKEKVKKEERTVRIIFVPENNRTCKFSKEKDVKIETRGSFIGVFIKTDFKINEENEATAKKFVMGMLEKHISKLDMKNPEEKELLKDLTQYQEKILKNWSNRNFSYHGEFGQYFEVPIKVCVPA